MGTNFYAKHIPTESEYAAMQEALTNKQFDKLQELLKDAQRTYHIGKRSIGWAFLFQAKEEPVVSYNEEAHVPWSANLESLKEYLNREDVQIVDEYGEKYTPEEFWNEEVGECLTVHDTPERIYDSHETYYRKHPEKATYSIGSTEQVKNGIRWCYCWFC